MVRIELETLISAPIERCFDLSRSIDLHMASTNWTGERAIAGVTAGLIGAGEQVTWRGRHFGLWITHTSRVNVRPIFRIAWCADGSIASATTTSSAPWTAEPQ